MVAINKSPSNVSLYCHNTFVQKLKQFLAHQLKARKFINRIAYTSIKGISSTQYDIQEWWIPGINKLFVISLYNITVKDMATYCFIWDNNIIYCGPRISFDIVCHSQQQWTLRIVAWHLSERHYDLTETFILIYCSVNLFVGK